MWLKNCGSNQGEVIEDTIKTINPLIPDYWLVLVELEADEAGLPEHPVGI